jgi:diadenosine tetraphosphatase ApaH/serine/threonine PP2A family protein phosphatase
MRVLVVSDIHANLAALEAVLADAEPFDYEAVWCLGDTVGYGPEPGECIARLRLLKARAVVGNHDWAVIGRMDAEDFNREARRGVLWTREQLGAESLAWLSSLSSEPIVEGDYTLTHGSPRDPVWEYILYPSVVHANLTYFDTPFCLVGHTHLQTIFSVAADDHTVNMIRFKPGQTIPLQRDRRSILNPGSVGQPRDNDPRAAYAILDTVKATWTPRRVAYPIEITQAHMRAAGLPERLITRLDFGW